MKSITLRSIVYSTLKYNFLTMNRNNHKVMSYFSLGIPHSQRTGHVYLFLKSVLKVYHENNTHAYYFQKLGHLVFTIKFP